MTVFVLVQVAFDIGPIWNHIVKAGAMLIDGNVTGQLEIHTCEPWNVVVLVLADVTLPISFRYLRRIPIAGGPVVLRQSLENNFVVSSAFRFVRVLVAMILKIGHHSGSIR